MVIINQIHHIYRLYERWAKGSFGLILTGNVQIDDRYPGLMTDLMISSREKTDIEKWNRYADACQSHGTPAIVQINHARSSITNWKTIFYATNNCS